MTPERLADYRKMFGAMSTEELKAIIEGRKPNKLGAEALDAIRHLLAERGHKLAGTESAEGHVARADPKGDSKVPGSGTDRTSYHEWGWRQQVGWIVLVLSWYFCLRMAIQLFLFPHPLLPDPPMRLIYPLCVGIIVLGIGFLLVARVMAPWQKVGLALLFLGFLLYPPLKRIELASPRITFAFCGAVTGIGFGLILIGRKRS